MIGQGLIRKTLLVFLLSFLSAVAADSAVTPANTSATQKKDAAAKKEVEPTTITSDSAEFDQKTQKALLSGSVHVIHQGMELWADRVDVKMDKDNQVQDMVATGNIVIKRPEGTATCGRAEYKSEGGSMVLTENPILRQGPNLLEAPLIRFNQAEGKFKAEGGTRMRFIQKGQDDPVSQAYRKRTGTTKTP